MFGSTVPVTRHVVRTKKLDLRTSPQVLFGQIQDSFEYSFLLESAKGKDRLAEYSFIGFEPAKLMSVKDGALEFKDRVSGERTKSEVSDPLLEIRQLDQAVASSGPFRFVGGAVGYFSYDSVRYWEKIPEIATDDLKLPDLEFGIFHDGLVFDHASGQLYYYYIGEDRLESVLTASKGTRELPEMQMTKPVSRTKKELYEESVRTAKEYIKAGDIFQVVLSKRYDFESDEDLTRFYNVLSKVNPSPYMYYLKFGERRIVGSSPEMLVRVDDGVVETFPIAGTRPHLPVPKENAKLTNEMLHDEKETAEHVMLVDLARNDIGRVAKYGTVKVPELLTVQQFSHVQHIVSHVVGELGRNYDSYDALRAIFPAGTLSGAPKPRAMEIIEELEPVRRGPYGGAVGYFSLNGNADFAITIRTLVADGNRCSIQAGAGIVADSVPEKEWFETESKAAGLMHSLEIATGGDKKRRS